MATEATVEVEEVMADKAEAGGASAKAEDALAHQTVRPAVEWGMEVAAEAVEGSTVSEVKAAARMEMLRCTSRTQMETHQVRSSPSRTPATPRRMHSRSSPRISTEPRRSRCRHQRTPCTSQLERRRTRQASGQAPPHKRSQACSARTR